jgi:protein-tyrosine phosphatase
MGISRSSSLVIAFLMKEFGMDYHKAKLFTKGKRSIIMPNDGFEKDLLKFGEWLKEHHDKKYELEE